MTLRLRLALAFSVVVALFAANFLVWSWNARRSAERLTSFERAVDAQLQVREVEEQLDERWRQVRGYTIFSAGSDSALTEDERNGMLEAFTETRTQVELLQRLSEAEADDRRLADRVADVWTQLEALWQPDFAPGAATRSATELDTAAERARTLLDSAHVDLATLRRLERDRVAVARADIAGARDLARHVSLASVSLSAIVAVALAALLAAGITRELRRLAGGARRIGEGHLDEAIAPRGGPELAAVGMELNRMAARLREARDARENALRTAEAASLAKSAFLANTSHELRTPLNSILGYAELLLEDARAAGGSDSIADLERIVGAGRHLRGLIDDVLDLSKIEAGKMTLTTERFAVATLIDEVLDTAAPLVAARGNRLERKAEDLGVAWTDGAKLRQVLLNLLANAAKFTTDGVVTLRAERGAALSEDDGDLLVFEVIDSGIGMTASQLRRVFDPFTQADGSTTRRYGGTGLGLGIARELARLLGGSLDAESAPGQGSTFRFTVPAIAPREAADEAPETHSIERALPASDIETTDRIERPEPAPRGS
ncbi:MAG: HAMP domain-containing sensor histidine kinase [Acidobacteriota bacterium]